MHNVDKMRAQQKRLPPTTAVTSEKSSKLTKTTCFHTQNQKTQRRCTSPDQSWCLTQRLPNHSSSLHQGSLAGKLVAVGADGWEVLSCELLGDLLYVLLPDAAVRVKALLNHLSRSGLSIALDHVMEN